jgi:transcriptional regulator with XRE-family HTH domain
MTTMKTLGERLRARRRELGLNISQVADAAGLSLPYVSNLERGHGNPTLEALRSLATALDMPITGLLDAGEPEEVLADLALASLPPSLERFSKTDRFEAAVQRLADAEKGEPTAMRRKLLIGMVNAPRRSTGEPTEEDWRRLLDTYRLILEQNA